MKPRTAAAMLQFSPHEKKLFRWLRVTEVATPRTHYDMLREKNVRLQMEAKNNDIRLSCSDCFLLKYNRGLNECSNEWIHGLMPPRCMDKWNRWLICQRGSIIASFLTFCPSQGQKPTLVWRNSTGYERRTKNTRTERGISELEFQRSTRWDYGRATRRHLRSTDRKELYVSAVNVRWILSTGFVSENKLILQAFARVMALEYI